MNNSNIMIVDDDPYVLSITSKLVEKMGYSYIITCNSGQLALEYYRDKEESIDIIMCDLNMPEMSGVEFLRHIADRNYTGGVILISSEDKKILATAQNLAKARNLNVLGYVSKPLKPKDLEPLLAQYSAQDIKVPKPLQNSISEDELCSGINGENLLIAYQPKLNIATGMIDGVEALARWNHSERGTLSPDTFIPLAEQSGLIDEITYAIYRKILLQIKMWREIGIFLKISINISVNSFLTDGFVDFLIRIAKDYNILPEQIIFEITETQVMENTLDCLEMLMQLRMKRFELSIDDFGTGHSSMSQLKKIPFTELKIDRSFVHGACEDSCSRSILESNIDLAKKLKIKTVAEGVETEAELNLIKELGCDQAQGYFIAKPMFADDFEIFFRSYSST